eukprot:Opistho-2@56664
MGAKQGKPEKPDKHDKLKGEGSSGSIQRRSASSNDLAGEALSHSAGSHGSGSQSLKRPPMQTPSHAPISNTAPSVKGRSQAIQQQSGVTRSESDPNLASRPLPTPGVSSGGAVSNYNVVEKRGGPGGPSRPSTPGSIRLTRDLTVEESLDPTLFIALYDYESQVENGMSFKKGDHFKLLDSSNENWWQVQPRAGGVIGYVPSNYIASIKSVQKHAWFHGRIARSHAEHLLSSGINGSFLIRESESNQGEYSISVRYEGRMYHYRVGTEGNNCFITKEHQFSSLEELVQHHTKMADGLITVLKYPVGKKDKPTVFGVSHEDDKWEIDRMEINLGKKLGAGQYGEVYEGVWKKNVKVAVKTLKEESMELSDFIQEAAIMKKIKHSNLVQLLGVCTKELPYYILTEYMPKGNLLDFLRNPTERARLDPTILMFMASQVSAGMQYLEERNFIHRDLAARNCLVAENYKVKVADFGLSRLIEDEYTAREGAKFPIKWTAPEALLYNVFTTKSDVWAFGILLWEIATYGDSPYPGVELGLVLDKLEAGYRMPQPDGCPDEVYEVMLDCWKFDPATRPTFKDIRVRLETMFPNQGINEAVEKAAEIQERRKSMSVSAPPVSSRVSGASSSIAPPPGSPKPQVSPRPH